MLLRLTTIVAVFLAWVPVAQAWSWPVQGPVLQPFGYDEANPYAAGQHRGIDIGASAAGAPVVAPAGGTVSFAGSVPTNGKSVTIETADGYSVTLTHLGTIAVAEGASVDEGAVVGSVGPSGTPEQAVPYVHLGVRLDADPNGYLDPLGLLPAPVAEPPPATSGSTSTTAQATPVHASPPVASRATGFVIRTRPAATGAPRVAHAVRPRTAGAVRPAVVAAPPAVVLQRPLPESSAGQWHAVWERLPIHATPVGAVALTVLPGILSMLAAVATALRRRRPQPLPANIVTFPEEPPMRRAA